MMRTGWMRTLGIGLALTLALAACSGDDDTSTPVPAASESPTGQETPSGEESPSADAATVQLAESDLGSILVDADGMTLYLFEADTDGTSTCYDDCAETWPPLVADAPTAGDGLDAALLDTTERDDGELQVTYAGHPLYYFAPDQAPGDTDGQGLNDVWYVVDAAGEAVTT
jgi:predicted lipoprotein with Yx(FWY)xxD motif